MAPPDFLCYRPAYYALKAGDMTEPEYYHDIFQHLVWEHDCEDKGPVNADVLGQQIRYIIRRCSHYITDTTPFEEIFPAFRKGPEAFANKLARVPEDMHEPWYKAVAFVALKERDVASLKWVLERCEGQFPDKFNWEAYFVKQNRETDSKLDECWRVIQGSRFQEPVYWKSKNPKRALVDPMW